MDPKKNVRTTELLQLDRYLQQSGKFSRREAAQIIKSGRVTVDGKKEIRPFRRVNLAVEKVRLDGKFLKMQRKHVHILWNNPRGLISTHHDPQGRRTIYSLLPKDRHMFSVGRLDMDTSGVILLTSDGELARRLELPETGIKRVYRAVVDGKVNRGMKQSAAEGLEIDGIKMRPAILERVSRTPDGGDIVDITVTEGKYHEVKRIMEALGRNVIRLDRLAFAGLTTEGLGRGKWRALTRDEIRDLLKLTKLWRERKQIIEECDSKFNKRYRR